MIRFVFFLAITIGLLLPSGCTREKPPMPGSGEHKITHIIVRTAHGTGEVSGTEEVKVREAVPLIVKAVWAIPSMTDVTKESRFSVSDSSVGEVDSNGVFRSRKAGKITIQVSYTTSLDDGKPRTFQSALFLIVKE